MIALAALLDSFRKTAQSEREKGDYFERLVKIYLQNEPYYADLYAGKVWLWEDWRREWISRGNSDPGADAGIDLVAETTDGELHAIQAKFYDESARLSLENLSTFFTASGKKHFSRRWVVLTATAGSFAVCSDSEVGKKRGDDDFELALHELQYPATTEARSLAKAFSRHHDGEHLGVVFSTYHSIAVLNEAQQKHGLPEFDLILCDEAHRTTGQSFDTEDESAFVRVHDQAYLAGKKRVYMTATPRVYGTAAKVKAEQEAEYTPAIKAQTLGEGLQAHRLEKLNRYETHLDRKFERTLAMLLKLKDLRGA